MKKILFYSVLLLFVFGCNSDEYSPNQVFNRNTEKDVNAREIAALPKKPIGTPIKIVISGDTQRSYKEAIAFVNHVNARNDIDFVILNGDISDFGLLLEFEGILKIYEGLKVPFISVIGNHDLVANGRAIYERMFGPLNFTFNYAGVRFVCHDTNGREYNFNSTTPNLTWLKDNFKLNPETTHLVAISHVPPNDADFDPNLVNPYENLFNQTPGLIASIHSHRHGKLETYYQNGKGIPFLITNAIVNSAYTILDIKNGQIHAEEINF